MKGRKACLGSCFQRFPLVIAGTCCWELCREAGHGGNTQKREPVNFVEARKLRRKGLQSQTKFNKNNSNNNN